MKEKFVRVLFDLTAERTVPNAQYRIYVNDELMTERTWRWNDWDKLVELLQIKTVPGKYEVKIEKVNPVKTNFQMSNMRVELGDARIKDNVIEIY